MSSFARLAPDPTALVVAVAIDLIVGDPVYPVHPVRLIGRTLQWFEDRLRAVGLDGYGGGILLFVLLAGLWLSVFAGIVALALAISTTAAWVVHVLLVYSLLALGDLLHHVWRIESAVRDNDIDRARQRGQRVGRARHRTGWTARRAGGRQSRASART